VCAGTTCASPAALSKQACRFPVQTTWLAYGLLCGRWVTSAAQVMARRSKAWCVARHVVHIYSSRLLTNQWPYTYDACDVGTLPNQTQNGLPAAALSNGDAANGGVLSFLPGQRLSRCTCTGESHPGPKHSDGTFVGRSAPEIDLFEATIGGSPKQGRVSQSLQVAPFTFNYTYPQGDGATTFYNGSELNPEYKGGVFQQAMSALSFTDQQAYELDAGTFSTYGFEYKPGFDDAVCPVLRDARKMLKPLH
jgi:beta-glucanase (GH16 family)